MHWLSENYKWLFDGVGGAAIVGLIAWLWRRFFKESAAENTNATLNAQHSQVTNSPVASGSGIIQNIVNVGQQPPAEPPPKPVEPSPNIQRGDVGLRAIELVGDTWMYAHDVKGQHVHGILLEVRNEAKDLEAVGNAYVKGELTFHGPNESQQRISPCPWIDAYLNFLSIPVAESRWIVAAVGVGKDDWRAITHLRGDNYAQGKTSMDMVILPITEEFFPLEVRIISRKEGKCLEKFGYQWRWRIGWGHLDIKPL